MVKMACRHKDVAKQMEVNSVNNNLWSIGMCVWIEGEEAKSVHLLPVIIGKHQVDVLVDIGASMLMMFATTMRKLGIMHLMIGLEHKEFTYIFAKGC